jgi:hypothetical protein
MKTTKRAATALAVCLTAVAAFTAAGQARSSAEPRNTAQPSIQGTATVGNQLHVTTGTWTNSPKFTYQWYLCENPGKTNCKAISGANDNDYTLKAADAGHTIYAAVTGTNSDGANTVQTDAEGPVQGNAAPQNTAAPTISGTAAVGQTLTASNGTFTQGPTDYDYQWLRCDSSGASCGAIAGAEKKTYAVGSDDSGSTLRVRVTAKNAKGSDTATSAHTAVVGSGAATTTTTPATGGSAVPVSTVSLPDRLIVSGIKFSPSVLHARGPFQAQFTVTDTKGRRISGALVYVLGLPYNYLGRAREVPTDANGVATVTLNATGNVPSRASVVMFVRARKPGDNLLAGVSTRRLVQVLVRIG